MSSNVESGIRAWNIVLAFVHGAFTVACAAAPRYTVTFYATTVGVQWPSAYNGSLPEGIPKFRPHNENESVDFDFRWIVGGFFFVTAVAHAAYASFVRGSYEAALAKARQPYRWIEYSISASLMASAVAYSCAVVEWFDHFLIVALVATCMAFGHMTEELSRPASSTQWVAPLRTRLVPHLLGYVPLTAAFYVIGSQFSYAATSPLVVYEFANGTSSVVGVVDNKMPKFVYYIVVTQFVGFFSFGFVQLFALLSPPSRYVNFERAYMVLSASVKVVLGLIVYSYLLFA